MQSQDHQHIFQGHSTQKQIFVFKINIIYTKLIDVSLQHFAQFWKPRKTTNRKLLTNIKIGSSPEGTLGFSSEFHQRGLIKLSQI